MFSSAKAAQVDVGCAIAAIGVIFRLGVSDKGRKLTQSFHRRIGARFLEPLGRVGGHRNRGLLLRGRNVRTGNDDSLGYRLGRRWWGA